MKKSIFKNSSLFLILGFCWISIIGKSQDVKSDKEEKKELRKAERLKDYEALGTMLESRKFVFAVDRVQSATGVKITNVIRLDGSRILISLEDPENTSGRNSGVLNNSTPKIGTTGIVFEGNIGRWELSKNSKNLSYSIRFEVNRVASNAEVVYEIFMNIHADKSAGVEIENRTVFVGFPRENRASTGGYTNYSGHIREY
jgi:hypothetical protein